MADQPVKFSDLPVASALDGSEPALVQQAGVFKKAPAQMIADLLDVGTAAAKDVEDFASAAQGAKADTALQNAGAFDPAGAAAAVTKTSIGLGDVTNTADADKPVSTAQATALASKATSAQGAKADTALQGLVEGANVSIDTTDPWHPVVSSTASGSGGGFVYQTNVANYAALPPGLGTGDAQKGWVSLADGLVYIWSGTAFPAEGAGAPFKGPMGPTATVAVGTVTALSPGATPTVDDSGTAGAAVFNFGLVPGNDGNPGADGNDGADGVDGLNGSGLVPFNSQSLSSYTLTIDDLGTEVDNSFQDANSLFVPPDVFASGNIVLLRPTGDGDMTVVPLNSDMVIDSAAPSMVLSKFQLGSLHFQTARYAFYDGPAAGVGVPQITITTNFPDPAVGVPYSGWIHGSNSGGASGTISYSATGLPAGLTIDPATGDVTGTPTTAGTVTATFSVTNGTQTATPAPTHEFVTATAPAMTLIGTLPAGSVGAAYSHTLTLGGAFTAPVTMSLDGGALPPGIGAPTVSGNIVTYSGTPTTAATYAFTPMAMDSSGTPQHASDPQTVVIAATVADPAIVQNSAALWLPSATFDTPPTAGNQLLAALQTIIGMEPDAAPDGWAQIGYKASVNQKAYIYSKTSDGTETGIAFALAATGHNTVSLIEASNCQIGSVSVGSQTIPSNGASVQLGTTDAPISAKSIPILFTQSQRVLLGSTVDSPWVNNLAVSDSGASGAFGGFVTGPAPNAAVTVTVAIGTPVSSVNSTVWANVWLDPV